MENRWREALWNYKENMKRRERDLQTAHNYEIFLLADDVKNSELGNKWKDDGNKAFQSGDYHTALKLYNKSVQLLPYNEDSSSEMAVAVANRSAALYHLQDYQQTLDDIRLALSLGYPLQLHYKVLERRARCLLATNQLNDALEAFKTTLTCLDAAAKLPLDKRMKTQKNIQIMIAILLKNKSLENAPLPATSRMPAPSRGVSPELPSASHAVAVEWSEQGGRFATATRDVAPGETVIVEQPHCAVLLAEYAHDHCTHCFRRLVSLVPCPRCCDVGFCSVACQGAAMRSYHNVECRVTGALWASGASVTALMALRILSQRSPSHFLDLRPRLLQIAVCSVSFRATSRLQEHVVVPQLDAGASPRVPYRGDDYETVYQLVRHEDRRTAEDFFQRSAVAVFLFRCLQLGGYFGPARAGAADNGPGTLTAEERFFGWLLLQHLQLLQFNAHEVSELQITPGARPHMGRSAFIGGGLYPTLALFNHSCEPAVTRYFEGTCVVVRTVKTVRAGEMIAENYGPVFTRERREARRGTLREQYWFECECTPCREDWPLFEEMDPGVIRFRCGAEPPCRAVVPVPVDTAEFLVRCPSCGGHTNIMKGLKTLQDTDAMFRAAGRLLEGGQTTAALVKFLQVLQLLDETLAPPFRDYHLCQQSVRRCMLSLGNLAPPSTRASPA
ncbi:SET and MYND domain-containing protein 4 isoform X5 [Bacillus rossius redtenbacheri]|uniref:SET and MYND domain-containing protein 4 isoform X5 n=1 Tax=Bacillus rossius redtenbacheri TaxID=93214 RepID=UPI002FDCCE53